jgi:hypothetical protein
VRLAPDLVAAYASLGFDYLALNRLDGAKAALNQGLARKSEDEFLRWGLYLLAFLQDDAAQMERQVAWAAAKPEYEGDFQSIQGTGSRTTSTGLDPSHWFQGISGFHPGQCCAAGGGVG